LRWKWVCGLLFFALIPQPANAQVHEVVVGVTPNCPYGIKACWGGAHEALGKLEGVKSVDSTPDAYNCTGGVDLKSNALPDPDKWADQFKKAVDQNYVFRGVEITVEGVLEKKEDGLVLRIPKIDEPLRLAALGNKLQWNFKKRAARQPEPDEKDAHDTLARVVKNPNATEVKVMVTGPLRKEANRHILEVREFTQLAPSK
jgi:hypothetical protein